MYDTKKSLSIKTICHTALYGVFVIVMICFAIEYCSGVPFETLMDALYRSGDFLRLNNIIIEGKEVTYGDRSHLSSLEMSSV